MDEQGVVRSGREPLLANGAMGAWWRQGARTAFLMRPNWDGLQTTPLIIFWLVAAPVAWGLLTQRLYIETGASFYWVGLLNGWLPALVNVWICWLLVPENPDQSAPGPSSARALFSMLSAQSLTVSVLSSIVFIPLVRGGAVAGFIGSWAHWVVWWLVLTWDVAAQITLIWRSGMRTRVPRVFAAMLLLATVVVAATYAAPTYWYPTARSDKEPAYQPLQLTQDIMEEQPKLLTRDLESLQPQRPGIVDMYVITFSPYADEDVFKRESDMVANVMGERFDASRRVVKLINHRDTMKTSAWATPLNLKRAIDGAARVMDRDEDVLFIHLTSHGARAGNLATSFWPLTVDDVTPAKLKIWLDGAGIRNRVISVSACFSGSWIAPLAGDGTLIMIAADADHTSYGCGRGSQLTYFGRAMYDEQMRKTWSFEQAHAAAKALIEKREKEVGKSDGFSNPQIAVGDRVRERLGRLEQERNAAWEKH